MSSQCGGGSSGGGGGLIPPAHACLPPLLRLRLPPLQGYYKDPAKTAEALDAEGWLHSGDIGLWDERGTLWGGGRKGGQPCAEIHP